MDNEVQRNIQLFDLLVLQRFQKLLAIGFGEQRHEVMRQ
jgi:hypothetical protein